MDVRLSDEELADVVRRAHEIQSLQGRLDGTRGSIEEYVRAAEETGVPREAMLQALNERFAFLTREIENGQLVFAKSGDGRQYPAKVIAVTGDAVSVRFLNGGEGIVGRHELADANFAPGTDYEYLSPSYMVHMKAPVARYDRDAMTVTFNNWGTEETVPLAKVRTLRPKKAAGTISPWILTVAVSAGTGILGAIAMWIAMR